MSPAQILETYPALTIAQAAEVLNLHCRDGQPNRRAVRDLVRAGRLAIIDCSQPVHRWTVSAAECRRYLGGAS